MIFQVFACFKKVSDDYEWNKFPVMYQVKDLRLDSKTTEKWKYQFRYVSLFFSLHTTFFWRLLDICVIARPEPAKMILKGNYTHKRRGIGNRHTSAICGKFCITVSISYIHIGTKFESCPILRERLIYASWVSDILQIYHDKLLKMNDQYFSKVKTTDGCFNRKQWLPETSRNSIKLKNKLHHVNE